MELKIAIQALISLLSHLQRYPAHNASDISAFRLLNLQPMRKFFAWTHTASSVRKLNTWMDGLQTAQFFGSIAQLMCLMQTSLTIHLQMYKLSYKMCYTVKTRTLATSLNIY